MSADLMLEAIWTRRKKAFRAETMPYFRYMGQSGFPAFLSLIFISSAIGYITLINNLPSNFPFATVGVISLLLVLCWSPLRTWLEAGDTVFMMPREAEMDGYMSRSFRYTSVGFSLLALIVFLLYLPIYNQGPAISGGWLLAFAAAFLKGGNIWGAWRERQIAWSGMRRLMRLLRWAATALMLTAWLTCVVWQSAAFTVLVSLLFMFLYHLPSRHHLPWERLIAEEARTRKRYYVFFGLFIDVPTLPSNIAKRSYLSWVLGVIPYSNANTFVYLYTAALLRTEMGGIILRLLMLGCLITYWFSEAASLSGWGCIIVYVIFLGLIAVQLGGLRHVHRYSVWKHVYPLPEKQRIDQYVKVDRLAIICCAIVLWLFVALPLLVSGLFLPSLAVGAGTIMYIIIRPSRLRKKLLTDEDED